MRTAETIERDKAVTATEQAPPKPKKLLRSGCDPSVGKATQIKPGEVRNPGGRPKHDLAREIAKRAFERARESAIEAFADKLNEGNAYTFKELADRGYGKVTEKLEVTEAQPVKDEDLSARIAQLERDLGLAREIDEAGRVGLAKAGAGKANGAAKD